MAATKRELLYRYHFFDALGDLLRAGPTGTNVNDLLFILAAQAAGS
ncbi:MAG: hypothetical protein DRJ03_17845 [Chloroflexi bacterium]|nr:MAG: hypothetical protein DRI81_09355 [Chloroflexota bacterium]RLC83220.1 MAG: hypothetical protein DRJ03_17845 [Chloroflexota bacterium]